MVLRPCSRNPAVADEPAAGRHDFPQVAQVFPHTRDVPGEAEVVPHHQGGVELPEAPREAMDARFVDLLEASNPGEGALGRGWLGTDLPEPLLLQVQRVPAGAAPDVQDPAA